MGELAGGVQFILFQGIKSDSDRYIQSQDVCELNRTESLTPIFASTFYIVMPKFRQIGLMRKLDKDAAGRSIVAHVSIGSVNQLRGTSSQEIR